MEEVAWGTTAGSDECVLLTTNVSDGAAGRALGGLCFLFVLAGLGEEPKEEPAGRSRGAAGAEAGAASPRGADAAEMRAATSG